MTTRKRLADDQEKIGDYWRDSWQPGKTATEAGTVCSPNCFLQEEETHHKATDRLMEKYPQGCPRGGGDEHPTLTEPRIPTNGDGQTTMTAVCRCRKICKNSRGLKIHQARMKCLVEENMSQHTDITPDETQKEPGQESPHRAQSLHVAVPVPPILALAKVQIKWPPACKTTV